MKPLSMRYASLTAANAQIAGLAADSQAITSPTPCKPTYELPTINDERPNRLFVKNSG